MPPLKYTKFLLPLILISASQCFADAINVGFMTFDAEPATAAFDITNLTGANASTFPDMSFPVVSSVPFADLTLFVNFDDGTVEEFDSYNGESEPDFATKPIDSAILTGTFGATDLLLNDGSIVTIDPSLFAIVTASDPSGILTSGDFALIQASTVPNSAVPEPNMAILMTLGLAGAALRRRVAR
jgi:PEP-CTERM motif